jgi:hypothetical protein
MRFSAIHSGSEYEHLRASNQLHYGFRTEKRFSNHTPPRQLTPPAAQLLPQPSAHAQRAPVLQVAMDYVGFCESFELDRLR